MTVYGGYDNGLDVFEYLSWLFRHITAANHNFTDEFLEELMPWSANSGQSEHPFRLAETDVPFFRNLQPWSEKAQENS